MCVGVVNVSVTACCADETTDAENVAVGHGAGQLGRWV